MNGAPSLGSQKSAPPHTTTAERGAPGIPLVVMKAKSDRHAHLVGEKGARQLFLMASVTTPRRINATFPPAHPTQIGKEVGSLLQGQGIELL